MTEWYKKDEMLAYDGYRKIIKRTFISPSNQVIDYDIVSSNGGAAILAMTTDSKIICFKQFRPGPEATLFELPGGAIEPHEEPMAAVRRELQEETGYSADVEWIGDYYRDAYMSGKWSMFVGRNAMLTGVQKLDNDETGELLLLSIEEFKDKLFKGMMTDTTLGYAGLLKFNLL